MKKVAFTIAFGKRRYKIMAEALRETMKIYAPDVEFIIFTEDDITPYEKGLPTGRKLYPKDYKYPKIEIMTKLRDPDTQYLFIDADCFVFCNLDHIYNKIEPGKLVMHWVYNEDNTWAGIKELNFVDAWKQAGFDGLEPYSLNSGFIGWQGHMECFDKALELIKGVSITADDKGKRGDEYYYCAGIQLTKTPVISTQDFDNELGMFWRGKIGKEDEKLTCDFYEKTKLIQHYGAHNWANLHVQSLISKALKSEGFAKKISRLIYTLPTVFIEGLKALRRTIKRKIS